MQRQQCGEYHALWYQGLQDVCVGGGGGGGGGGGRGGGGVMIHSNKEKSLRHIAMVAKFLDLKHFRFFSASMAEKNENTWHVWHFLCMIALRNKTVAHTFPPSFDNTNGHLCQDRLPRSRNYATMVTWRHSSFLYSHPGEGTEVQWTPRCCRKQWEGLLAS